jgi:hypothetical protein
MRHGAQRTETEYAWPDVLLRPRDDKPLVYLDLNHWITLAKAASGHRHGERHREALEALRGANAVFPLSAAHYMEMAGITDPRQRYDVAAVMEELTGFRCLMPNPVVMRAEIDAAVRRLVPGLKRLHQPIPLIGRGVLQAFGMQGGLRIKSAKGDVTDEARKRFGDGPEAFDAWREDAERQLDRSVLRGPTDDEAPELQRLGWDPSVARRGAERRAQQEREQAQRLDAEPRWRRGRLRDIVAARYLVTDAEAALNEVLLGHHLRLTDVASDPEAARRFTDSMPSGDVWISLVTAAHRNPQTRWTSNDMFDIDALSVAVAYCDIVVTENHARHVLRTAGAPDRLGTELLVAIEAVVERL